MVGLFLSTHKAEKGAPTREKASVRKGDPTQHKAGHDAPSPGGCTLDGLFLSTHQTENEAPVLNKASVHERVRSKNEPERDTHGAERHTRGAASDAAKDHQKTRGAVNGLARLSMCLLGVFAGLGAGACGSPPARPPRWTALRPESGPLLSQVEREASAALRAGYVPIVELSARWCWPCEELRRESSSPPLAQALDGVTLLSLDIDLWGASLAEAGLSDARIPAMYRLDAKGHPQGPPLLGEWKNPDEAARVLRAWLAAPVPSEGAR